MGAKYAEAQLNKATTTSFDLPPASLFGRLSRWPETDLKESRCSVSPSLKRLGLSSSCRTSMLRRVKTMVFDGIVDGNLLADHKMRQYNAGAFFCLLFVDGTRWGADYSSVCR